MYTGKLEKFLQKYRTKEVNPNHNILVPSKYVESAYYLESGYVKVFRIGKNGTEIVYNILKPGSSMPLFALLGFKSNKFYFSALTQCTVRIVPLKDFRRFVFGNEWFYKLLQQRLLNATLFLTSKIDEAYHSTAQQRVALALIYLSYICGIKEGNTVSFSFEFSHELISSLAGLSRETVSRKLEELKTKKIVEINYKKVKILEFSELKDISQR